MTKAEYWAQKFKELPYDCNDEIDEVMSWESEDGKWKWEEFTTIYEKIVDQSRWTTFKEAVIKLDDDSYLCLNWGEGSTEYQETYKEYTVEVVEPYEKTIIDYRPVK